MKNIRYQQGRVGYEQRDLDLIFKQLFINSSSFFFKAVFSCFQQHFTRLEMGHFPLPYPFVCTNALRRDRETRRYCQYAL